MLVAALQLHVGPTDRADALRARLDALAAAAAAAGARVLVGPGLAGNVLVETPRPDATALTALLEWGRAVARRHRVWCVPGTARVPAEATRGRAALAAPGVPASGGYPQVCAAAPAFDPDGRLVGLQAQTHPATGPWSGPTVEALGVEFLTWSEAGLRFGILAGDDAWSPEAARILALEGATAWLCPVAVRRPYPAWHQVAGPWQLAQQNQAFAVEAGLAGPVGGQVYRGRSAGFAPLELTPDRTGRLPPAAGAEPEGYADGWLVVDLDAAGLLEVRRSYPVFAQLNPRLYRRHLPGIYAGEAGPAAPAGDGAPT